MRILVACEFSGVVRDSFIRAGYDAVSCDLLPSESSFGEHYQGDVFDIINQGWDMMIAHPPCTYPSHAGLRWFNEERYGDRAVKRRQLRDEAFNFVVKLWNSNIEKVCIENPVGYLNRNWMKPTQIIQPYYFGKSESKRTCLWLRGLPLLVPTSFVEPTIYYYGKNGKPIYFIDHFGKTKDRSKLRSKFFKGVAEAMAKQW